MGSSRIVTLTLNPAIDVSSEAETVQHTHKVRTTNEAIEPGGGGINVARVLSKLGADVTAIFLGGGVTGRVLDDLLDRSGIDRRMIPIADDSRMSLTVVETSTGLEYRFVPEGPEVSAEEGEAVIEAVRQARCDYFVASGSLPRGLPDDFYVEVGRAARANGARFVLDTSGDALRAALDEGGVFLVKPSRREMESLAGHALDREGLAREAQRLASGGKAEHVVVTLGSDGAILADREAAAFSPAINVEACSAVGAGDSFLAGMVYGFAEGRSAGQALRVGLAAGAAAVLSCGSDLGKPEDLKRLVGAALSGEQVDNLGIGNDRA